MIIMAKMLAEDEIKQTEYEAQLATAKENEEKRVGKIKKAGALATALALVGGGVVGALLAGSTEHKQSTAKSDHELYISPDGTVHEFNGTEYHVQLSDVSLHQLASGHNGTMSWINYLESNGGVDFNRSSAVSDGWGDIHLNISEKNSPNFKTDVIPYGEVLEKQPALLGVDEVTYYPFNYSGFSPQVPWKLRDPDVVRLAIEEAQKAGNTVPANVTEIAILDRYVSSTRTTNSTITFGGKTVSFDEATFEKILDYAGDKKFDGDVHQVRQDWKGRVDAYFTGISQLGAADLLLMSGDEVKGYIPGFNETGALSEYNATALHEKVNKTGIQGLDFLFEGANANTTFYLVDTVNRGKYGGFIIRADNGVLSDYLKTGLSEDELIDLKIA